MSQERCILHNSDAQVSVRTTRSRVVRRKTLRDLQRSSKPSSSHECETGPSQSDNEEPGAVEEIESTDSVDEIPSTSQHEYEEFPMPDDSTKQTLEIGIQTEDQSCLDCVDLSNKLRITKNKLIDATMKLSKFKDPKLSRDYVEELYEFYLKAYNDNLLDEAQKELVQMTPANMDTMFSDKQSKEAALKKMEARKNMVVEDVPPTASVASVTSQPSGTSAAEKTRKAPRCKMCKNPMKGHSKIDSCPINQKKK